MGRSMWKDGRGRIKGGWEGERGIGKERWAREYTGKEEWEQGNRMREGWEREKERIRKRKERKRKNE